MDTSDWLTAANISLLFTEHPLLERPAAAARAGFEAVEMWWPFATAAPTRDDVETLVDAITAAGVRLVALNFPAGDMTAGDRGLLSDPVRAAAFRAGVAGAVEVAGRTGCRLFNALYGNAVDGIDVAAQHHQAATNLAFAAMAVDRIGGCVLVEAVNTRENPRYLLPNAEDAARVVSTARASGHSNVALLADVYHWAASGADPVRTLEDHAGLIGHVQIADCPGRHEPGTGSVDFAGVREALHRIGYRGAVAAEYRPAGRTEDGLGWFLAATARTA